MLTQKFYDVLIAEVTANKAGLTDEEYKTLNRYYRGLASNERLRPFYRYNWQRRIRPMTQRLSGLPRTAIPWRVLDAGCGVGTESILWAVLRDDVDVVGVDISPERLQTAVSRLAYHERLWKRPLSVQFFNRNIFDVLGERPFDLIWTMEAISHIDPAESFLSAAFDNLTPGGSLIISDSHLLNPAMMWRLIKMRRHVPLRSQKTLAGGEQISYAHERLFAVPGLNRLLRRAGFSKVDAQLSVFFPPRVARYSSNFQLVVRLESIWGKLPLFRQIGGIYTIVATK